MLNFINSIPHADYQSKSRIHVLRTCGRADLKVFVKRDDELGFGISGSKIRKYRSLMPYFLEKKLEEVVLIGGANSNNILGLAQLLIENGIKPTLFLRGDESSLNGNVWMTSLLVRFSSIHWISRSDWSHVLSLAEEYVKTKETKAICIVPEGAFMKEALPGALSLPLDILRNEEASQHIFDHIFIEAGTGFMAIALLLGFSWLKRKAKIHILLLADQEAAFLKKLENLHAELQHLSRESIPYPDHFELYRPTTAASFGSVNAQIFKEIESIARHEGFFTDPIYSAKLFLESKKIMESSNLKGNALIIHSGGALSLPGFKKYITPID